MIKYLFILFPTLVFSQAWVKLADYAGTRRDDGVAVVIDNKAYVGTGADQFNYTTDFFRFDLVSHQWSAIQSMPPNSERQYASAFKSDSCFYVSCGLGINGALNSTYRYNLALNTWSLVAPKPNAGLMSAACFQFGNKVILAGGKGNNDVINHEVWEYDLQNNSWLQKNNTPFSPLWRSAYSTFNGIGYLSGGVDSTSRFSKRLYQYTPTTDQWLLIDSMPIARGRAYAAMQTINNRLFIFGGFDSLNVYHNDAFLYDISSSTWIPAPAMPAEARKGGMSFISGRNFYYTCGINANGIRLNETWMTDVPLEVLENSKDVKVNIYCDANLELLQVSSLENKITSIEIFDCQAKRLKLTTANDQVIQLSVSDLEKGIYFLRIKFVGGRLLQKKFFRN